jgi:phenol 2-monooxygenase
MPRPLIAFDRVFTDDETFSTSEGGKLYESYGVSSSGGAIVVVRPDGYIGFVTFLDKVEELGNYLKQFMISRQ